MKLVEPVIVRPLLAEWAAIREEISRLSPGFGYVGKKKDQPNAARKEAQGLFMGFLECLDAAVAAAYGWTDYSIEMPDEQILRRLLALNLERSQANHVN